MSPRRGQAGSPPSQLSKAPIEAAPANLPPRELEPLWGQEKQELPKCLSCLSKANIPHHSCSASPAAAAPQVISAGSRSFLQAQGLTQIMYLIILLVTTVYSSISSAR